ncbi:hypothetical protein Tco_0168890 [Tanacetum coccineum]
MWESKSYQAHEDHTMLYEALEKSMASRESNRDQLLSDLVEARVSGSLSQKGPNLYTEPAWSIPSSDLTVPMNNWASALKSTYTPPPEHSLLAQIGDMTKHSWTMVLQMQGIYD